MYYRHMYIHTHTYTHTYTHIHIHTHTYIQVYIISTSSQLIKHITNSIKYDRIGLICVLYINVQI